MTEEKRGPGRPKSRANRPQRKMTLADEQGISKLEVVNPEPGYEYYTANDEGDRVERLKARGYEVVESNNEHGTYMGAINPKEVGTTVQTTVNPWGTKGVLMKIRKEWYDEDKKYKAEQSAKKEEALYRQLKEEGRTGDVKITQKPTSG